VLPENSADTSDPDADAYVQDIFGNQYTVIGHVERLPQKTATVVYGFNKKG
jgi:hypothetical protein